MLEKEFKLQDGKLKVNAKLPIDTNKDGQAAVIIDVQLEICLMELADEVKDGILKAFKK
jgi:hypothetical protein